MKLRDILRVFSMVVILAVGLMYQSKMHIRAEEELVNLAFEKEVYFSNDPNYALCTDPDPNNYQDGMDDYMDITDGFYSSTDYQYHIWARQGTVGWQYTNPVTIIIDLEEVSPISGAAVSMAGGCCGVNWPTNIYVGVSDDGYSWRYAGDLVKMAKISPPTSGYASFVYDTTDASADKGKLQTVGRYVSFTIFATNFTFVDEIEIYEGDASWLGIPLPGQAFSDFDDMIEFGQDNPNYKPIPVNIAGDRNVTFNKSPNYVHCTDAEDRAQITDGFKTNEYFWTQESTVGWSLRNPVIITIDLGGVRSISGISYRTAAGIAQVKWPLSLPIAVSNDIDGPWYYQGDLVDLAEDSPPANGYGIFTYSTHQLQTKGRYIAIGVVSSPYIFTDEIEVYRGDDAWLGGPMNGVAYSNLETITSMRTLTGMAKIRLQDDLDAVSDMLDAAPMDGGLRQDLQAQLYQDQVNIQNLENKPLDFKTILPLDNTHRDILSVRGQILDALGYPDLTIWKLHRYAWLSFLQTPSNQQPVQMSFSMLQNQHRSDALLLTNATGDPMDVTLQLQNPPAGATAGWIQMDYAEWTDTAQSIPVADALKPIAIVNGAYKITIPAGMTRKIWCTIDSSKVPAGSYNSSLLVNGGTTVPLSIYVSPITMNTPRFSLGMYDYTNNTGSYAMNAQNRASAIALMKSHYVDTAWASYNVLPEVKASDFDAEGKLAVSLDFTHLDNWISSWSGARHFYVYAYVTRPEPGLSIGSFAGAEIGTPKFEKQVESWAQAIYQHVTTTNNLQPHQFALLLVDEPHTDAQDDIISAWASAIKTEDDPSLTLYGDPTWVRPDLAANQDAITSMDVLCPNVSIYRSGGDPVMEYFEDERASGKKLWFYQCTGPVRLYSPQAYYRYQAWFAFSRGATGQGFWSFGDIGKAPNSWQEYLSNGINYAPAFIDTTTVYNSIHWDSVREGVQDYEEFAMLQDAINATSDPALQTQAQNVLSGAIDSIVDNWPSTYAWDQAVPNPNQGDVQLQNVRNMLETLSS